MRSQLFVFAAALVSLAGLVSAVPTQEVRDLETQPVVDMGGPAWKRVNEAKKPIEDFEAGAWKRSDEALDKDFTGGPWAKQLPKGQMQGGAWKRAESHAPSSNSVESVFTVAPPKKRAEEAHAPSTDDVFGPCCAKRRLESDH